MKARRVARCGLLSLTIVLAASALLAKDCGELPAGKNPSTAEIQKAMEELSGLYQVPLEIIAGVAQQESGVQQWRRDGSFVYNVTDCGLGMMQLTGATAEQFDVERLKSDWRYNLEAGVQVLVQKWNAAQRQYFKAMKPGERRWLENWYYGVALYWGGRETSYLRKIFGHIAARPGPLAQLVRAGIKVTIPDDAIPGFAFGQPFVADEQGFALADGKRHKLPVNAGTLGDPKLKEQLAEVLRRAHKARKEGRLPRAIRYYLLAQRHGGSGREAQESTLALKELGDEAEGKLKAGRELEAQGDIAGALARWEELATQYDGLPQAEAAAADIERVMSNPELARRAEELRREGEARGLLDRALALAERQAYPEALRRLKNLVADYASAEAAKTARERIAALEADPQVAKALEQHQRARDFRAKMSLAESFLANGRLTRAREVFQEALEKAPDQAGREQVQDGLRRVEQARAEGRGEEE